MTKASAITINKGNNVRTFRIDIKQNNSSWYDCTFSRDFQNTREFIYFVNNGTHEFDFKGHVYAENELFFSFEVGNPSMHSPFMIIDGPDIHKSFVLDEGKEEFFWIGETRVLVQRKADTDTKNWLLSIDNNR